MATWSCIFLITRKYVSIFIHYEEKNLISYKYIP